MSKSDGIGRIAISVKELAQTLGISIQTAYGIVKQNDFPSVRIGSRYCIPVDALKRWLEDGVTKNLEAD